jgi:transcriptional antiterminator RfaH
MPILPAEPDRFPDALFDADADADADPADPRRWWALHTKPRQEKALARQLSAASVPFYLPCVARRIRIRGRLLTSQVPLFTSYLFLLADRAERVTALATDRVVHAIEVHDQPGLWGDLRQIDQLIRTGALITPEAQLAPGAPVEITCGPLEGLQGTIVRGASGRRFVVRVNFIQQGASVLLEDFALVPLRGAKAAS